MSYPGVLDSCGDLVRKHLAHDHPGLILTKHALVFARRGEPLDKSTFMEAGQKPTLRALCAAAEPKGYDARRTRREAALAGLGGHGFAATLRRPLAMHLATALDNGGLCLHHTLGVPCLPGTGLKGLARQYACEAWFPQQPDRLAAARDVLAVFGFAPADDGDPKADLTHLLAALRHFGGFDLPGMAEVLGDGDEASIGRVGGVAFHDALPDAGYKLGVQVLTPHHRAYYQPKPKDAKPDWKPPAPGDWESPLPVNYPAVQPGARFAFRVTPAGADERRVDLAAEWLQGGLAHLGFGAKRSSGGGRFKVEGAPAAPPDSASWRRVVHQLDLATPAFLAGADQGDPLPPGDEGRDDHPACHGCDLTEATLRGQLRWWWRTLHAGHLTVAELRRLEFAVWGGVDDPPTASAVGTVLTAAAGPRHVRRVVGKRWTQNNENKPVVRASSREVETLGVAPARMTKHDPQGYQYLAYGMDEQAKADGQTMRKRRFVREGGSWSLELTARPAAANGVTLAADLVLQQATAALSLLTTFGGVGSKSRKGYGSLDCPGLKLPAAETLVSRLKAEAAAFRKEAGLGGGPVAAPGPESASLDWLVTGSPVEVEFAAANEWQAVDTLGSHVARFARRYQHLPGMQKIVLGLPRKYDNPGQNNFLGDEHRHYPLNKRNNNTARANIRHASPAPLHLAPATNGRWRLRALAFRDDVLAKADSRVTVGPLLDDYVAHLRAFAGTAAAAVVGGGDPVAQAKPATPSLPEVGASVDVWLKTFVPGKKATVSYGGKGASVQNPADLPATLKPGDPLRVRVVVAKTSMMLFEYVKDT